MKPTEDDLMFVRAITLIVRRSQEFGWSKTYFLAVVSQAWEIEAGKITAKEALKRLNRAMELS